MIFHDRVDAGKKLAKALSSFAEMPDTLVIALPRGGVVVGKEIAQVLKLPLDIVSPRKIGAPFNPELAVGAITETGEGIFSESLLAEFGISKESLASIIEEEKKEARRRLDYYRGERPPRDFQGKVVLVVDDGIATGATMRAAIASLKAAGVKKLVIAVPLAPRETIASLRKEVDQIICLSTPEPFYAVGQFYTHFDQTTDEEVIHLLRTPD